MDAQHQPPARVIAPAPAIVDDATSMAAGRYLELRREAAKVSIDDVPRNGDALRAAEADQCVLSDAQLTNLLSVFPFDPFIYQCLRDEIPAGRICVGCGCTWNDACIDPAGNACLWTDHSPARCSSCVVRLVKGGPATETAAPSDATQMLIAALRPFAAAARNVASACPDGREMEFRFRARDFRAAALALIHAGVR